MKLIGNILWILFGGLLIALEYAILGLLWCITIFGIPFGLQLFKCASLSLWPFGREVRYKHQTSGCLSTGMNLIWIILGGLLLALEHGILGLFFCITIIGIPFGRQHFKLAAIALTPFGREIMSSKKARQLEKKAQENSTIPIENNEKAEFRQDTSTGLNKTEEDVVGQNNIESIIVSSKLSYSSALTNSPTKKQNMIIAGGFFLTILVGFLLWLLFTNNNSNLLYIEKPQWKKFIMVTSENIPAHKEAKNDSPKLMIQIENVEGPDCDWLYRWENEERKRGYKSHVFYFKKNDVFRVLEEIDGWYKIEIGNGTKTAEAYISTNHCQEIIPTPITEEVLSYLNEKTLWRKDYLINTGKNKNLCLTSLRYELEGDENEILNIGYLIDGYLVYPDKASLTLVNNESPDIQYNHIVNNGYEEYILYYGSSHQYSNSEYAKIFNPNLISDELVGEIIQSIGMVKSNSYTAVYYFPNADPDCLFEFSYMPIKDNSNKTSQNNDTKGTKVTGFHVEQRRDREVLLAEFDSASEDTNVDFWGPLVDIKDLDGDGNVDALVQNGVPGSSGVITYSVVYYDEVSDKFMTTENSIMTMSDSPVIVDWENKKCIAVYNGIQIDRYFFEPPKLIIKNSEKGNVGNIVVEIPIDKVFDMTSENSEPEEREVSADINGDGVEETIVFSHSNAHGYAWGDFMGIERIRWADGTFTDNFGMVYTGDTFAFLNNLTNGLPDILVRGLFLYRWSGSSYEQWDWNGTEFIKVGL